ncbi:MAG: hypothetical protein Kow0013_10020 [Pararhodobacter sp.]
MARTRPSVIALSLALSGLAGCVTAAPQPGPALGAPEAAVYRGVETRLLEDDLVNFVVRMEGARDMRDPIAYARCAAAQYALIRGYGFARHVRTTVTEQGRLWVADAVYVVSPALPQGARTIDAEVTVADCTELGIPTV